MQLSPHNLKMLTIFQKVPKSVFVQSVRKISETHSEFIYKHLEGSDKGIAVFALNRPKQKNALGANLIKELQNGLQEAHFDDSIRALIIRSLTPGAFCVGADLKERLAMPESEIPAFVSTLRSVMQQIHNLPFPVIAALDGLALGGGLELALACDLRVASDKARMGLVESKLAVFPGAGGTQRLPRLINPAIAKELIFTSRIIGAKEALKLGIVNQVTGENEGGDAAFLSALDLAREILPNGPLALRLAKKAINQGLQVDLATGLKIEEQCYAEIVPTRDRVEGLKAFSEKRKPVYIGK